MSFGTLLAERMLNWTKVLAVQSDWNRTVGNTNVIGISVIAVLVVLIWLIFFPTHKHGSARRAATLSNIKQLMFATLLYAQDSDGYLPPQYATNEDLRTYLGDNVKNDRIFESANEIPSTILGNSLLELIQVESVANPADTVALFEARDWEKIEGRNFGFLDGHAKFRKWFSAEMLKVEFIDELIE